MEALKTQELQVTLDTLKAWPLLLEVREVCPPPWTPGTPTWVNRTQLNFNCWFY